MVIVTLESHDLDRRPDPGVACAMNGKGRMSPKGPPDRLSLWLRPRDVRTGDAAHRPREMRRSCQLKADGCRGDPDSLYLATDAFCSCDTTNQPNTHSTESREVLYPWHAWHGRSVWIRQAMVKNGVAIFHCGLEQAASRLLQIPQWMFDRTTCRGMHLAPTPAISINAMLELKRLLVSATSGGHQRAAAADAAMSSPMVRRHEQMQSSPAQGRGWTLAHRGRSEFRSDSRRVSVVIAQDPAQPLATL
jgi:hypothetical protein